MYKIEIDWGFKSPFMQVLRGTVRVDNIVIGSINPEEVHPSQIKKDQHTLGYKNGTAILNRCQPLVDVMVRSYFDGMRMSDCSIEWFRDCHRHNNEIHLTLLD
jgi:hypothetical protein